MTDELQKVRAWAQAKLDAQQEPPWAVKRYKDLISLLDEILASQAATIDLEDSLRLGRSQGNDPRQAANIVEIDTARRRRSVISVRLPM
jgi:hypothetical protein